jgi:thiamine biosynthesis protein ThiS
VPNRAAAHKISRVNILVNGEPRVVADGMTLDRLLAELGVTEPMVATEVNLAIVPRAERGRHALREGDRVEVVSFVGGG